MTHDNSDANEPVQQSLFEEPEEEKRSARWHMRGEYDRVFIMYGEESEVRARAAAAGYTDVCASGHYSYRTNTIVGALDGPTAYYDGRKVPGS